ncbi:glycosyltransferase family 4 protein [Mucilaginibacter aquaedulcis]|uniref:glycosyltransferase family 4 protein n=1 Tax=Mucilaginibacter aquaedulcis TaxID=1187081 RepID=UPI0025B40C16|nr:glycosyltransferase family 4 protein [Mucilaginibacter aquaedulcis]MDN3548554.1 glycosyltransferase family 4 protein [Mucilaginibacter aquaedulcis]
MKKKLLISAYAISPFRGSEYASAWNTVVRLAQEHELWVIYGMSDDFMGDTQTLRQYIKDNPMPNVQFIEVQPGAIARTITLLDKAGFGWFFYFAYYLWQKQVYQTALKVLETVDINVLHQLGPIGFREPGFLWRIDKPMVWGPIGGMNVIDPKLLESKPFSTRFKYSVKHLINIIQLNSPRIKKAFGQSGVLIAATKNGQRTIAQRFGRESYYLPDTSVLNEPSLDQEKFKTIHERVQLVWSGSHIARKNLEMCLDALAATKQNNWVLNVLGTGPLTASLQKKAVDLNIADRVIWHGHLKRDIAVQVMAAAHLHIITSIAEDNPAVVFEAMSYGVPTLTLDHCGMGDVINSQNGIKIKLDTNSNMVNNMSAALNDILEHPYKLVELAQTTLLCAADHAWDKRLAKLNSIYDHAIALRTKRYNSSFEPTIITA